MMIGTLLSARRRLQTSSPSSLGSMSASVPSGRPSYYSRGRAAVPPPAMRRRPRPGSLDRPVNGRLYRGTWLLVGLPLLVLAFSVARPPALQPPNLPPAFDRGDAANLADELATGFPNRAPGTPG